MPAFSQSAFVHFLFTQPARHVPNALCRIMNLFDNSIVEFKLNLMLFNKSLAAFSATITLELRRLNTNALLVRSRFICYNFLMVDLRRSTW